MALGGAVVIPAKAALSLNRSRLIVGEVLEWFALGGKGKAARRGLRQAQAVEDGRGGRGQRQEPIRAGEPERIGEGGQAEFGQRPNQRRHVAFCRVVPIHTRIPTGRCFVHRLRGGG